MKVHAVFFEAAFSKWAIIVAGEKALPETEIPEGGTLITQSLHTHCRVCAPGCSACGSGSAPPAARRWQRCTAHPSPSSSPVPQPPSPPRGKGRASWGGRLGRGAGVLESVLARTRTHGANSGPVTSTRKVSFQKIVHKNEQKSCRGPELMSAGAWGAGNN